MSRRSGNVSKMSGAAASSRDTGPTPSDTRTCDPSGATRLLPSTSSAAGSRAKTCRQQGAELASRVRGAVCGSSSRESFANWDRESSSWRTSQLSLLEGSETFSGAFPKAGMMRSGRAFEHPTLELHTAGSGSSSSRGAWPTPCASLHNDGEDPASWLARAEKLKKKHRNGNGAGMPLSIAARLWPTPCATDHKGSYRPGQRSGQLGDAVQCSGRLNADWVESLMGFPPGWTRTDGPSDETSHSPTESLRASPTSAESEPSG